MQWNHKSFVWIVFEICAFCLWNTPEEILRNVLKQTTSTDFREKELKLSPFTNISHKRKTKASPLEARWLAAGAQYHLPEHWQGAAVQQEANRVFRFVYIHTSMKCGRSGVKTLFRICLTEKQRWNQRHLDCSLEGWPGWFCLVDLHL